MSAFEVYLVMQANTVIAISGVVSLLSFVVVITIVFLKYLEGNNLENFSSTDKNIFRSFVIAFLICAFTPSTKTLALMYVLPKLTSAEFVAPASREAEEIYSLAKKALIKLAEEDSTKKAAN